MTGIREQDIKLVQAQVPFDVSNGGGAPTGVEIVDGVSNNIFADISQLDRVVGNVSLRQIYLSVAAAGTDVYMGARALIGKPPADPGVSALLFQTAFFDRRTDMQSDIESYLARGPRWHGHLFDTHIAGQRAIVLLQREGTELPAIGKTLVLVANEGAGTEYEQYVRVTDVSAVVRNFTIADGSAPRTFRRLMVTCEISDPLRTDFFGVEATDLDAGAPFAGKARVRDTIVADAASYYGASPLAIAASLGDVQVRAQSVYAALVPAAQAETPIVDANPNQAIVGAVAAAGGNLVSLPVSAAFDATHPLYVGGGILPGSLVITGAASITDRAGLLIDASGTQVGTVDYVSGVLTPIAPNSYPGSKVVSYRLGADPGGASCSMAVPVTPENRSSTWTVVLDPVPAAASLRLSYMAGGRWYVLSDAGDGALRGADSSFGAGQLNRATGSVVATLGAAPDVGSKIILTWAPSVTVSGAAPGTVRAYFELNVWRPLAAGSISVTWSHDGAAHSVTDSAGQLSGDGVGSVDYEAGRLRLSPNVLPAPGTAFAVTLSDAASGSSGAITLTDAGSTITGTLAAGVQAGSVAIKARISHAYTSELFNAPASALYTLVDNAGALHVIMGNGERSPSVGSINYVSGAFSISKSISGLVTVPFDHRVKTSTTVGGLITEGYPMVGYSAETVSGTLLTTGATARYTVGTGAGGSVGLPSGDLYIPHAAGAAWAEKDAAYVAGSYVSKNFIGYLGSHLVVNAAGVGQLYIDPPADTADWGAPAGIVSGAMATLTTWPAGVPGTVNIAAASGSYGGLTVERAVFRFPLAPLRPASVTVSATTIGGTLINATANASGVINTADMVGSVDFSTGIAEVVFKTAEGTNASPWAIDVSGLGVSGVSTIKAGHVRADSIRMAGVAYTYLPLDADIVGLDPVRLPSDGRVPIFRRGDVAVVHHTAETAPQTVINGQTLSAGRTRLARLRLIGNDGNTITEGYTADLDAGTAYITNAVGMSQPVRLEHMIKDEAVIADVQISGAITLKRALTHNFPVGAYVSSAMLIGNLFARVPLLFDQATWTNEWSDARIGSELPAQFNDIQFPIAVSNLGTVTERWALRFRNTTQFDLIGEHLGFIAQGDVTNNFAPINPAVGQPYFTIPAGGWGGGWPTGGVLRINTVGAMHPIGLVRTTQQGDATLQDDKFTLLILGDRDRV